MRVKQIVALTLALMLALSMAACGSKDLSWAAKSGEDTLPAGIYITFLMMGINDAGTKAEDPNDPLAGEIDGQPATEYVASYAKREVAKFLGINEKFRSLGLSLSEDDVAQYESYANYLYDMGGAYYEAAGVSKDSILAINENSMKAVLLFSQMYGEGGELEVNDQEYNEAFAGMFFRALYYVFPKMDFATGMPLTGEEIDKARADAEAFYDRAQAGENFVDLMYEHQLNSLEEGAEPPVRYEDSLYEYIVSKQDTSVPPAFLTGLGEAADGDIFKLEDEYYYYVVHKLDVRGAPQEAKDSYRMSVLQESKYDEFMAMTEGWGNDLDIQYNDDALKAYTPQKVQNDSKAYSDSLAASSSQAEASQGGGSSPSASDSASGESGSSE